jgi:DNA-binding winged helix-turn-helix (wHTH) protein/pimeloyl-ACP methyl ester carboxylesterase
LFTDVGLPLNCGMKYHFAGHVLDTERHSLTRGAQAVKVEPQVFDLLCLLLRNAGQLVSRDAMIAEIWQGRVVSDDAISAGIAAARRIVGDSGKRQAVIRTVPRRGLILVAEVVTEGETADAGPISDAAPGAAAQTAQRIRYTRSSAGHSLAYAVIGDGLPVARMGYLTSDLEVEWHIEAERGLFEAIAAQNTLLRFDPAGFGLSKCDTDDVDFAVIAEDLGRAADAAGFDRFALYSESGGALPAVRFAARYPERVSRLAIIGGYVDGRSRRASPTAQDPIRAMIDEGWRKPGDGFASGFLISYFPEGPLEVIHQHAAMMQAAANKDMMLKLRDSFNNASIADLLPKVQCPTLIFHARHDGVHPLSEAKKMASGIPDAELLVLETANHIPLFGNPVWPGFRDTLLEFLAG